MVLVDTSVWIDHLRKGETHLVELLHGEHVVCHPFIIGELACGNIQRREVILALLSALPTLTKADDAEVLNFIDLHRLMNQGLGLIDVHLLASCVLAGDRLWTRDRRLGTAAARLALAYPTSRT